MHVPLYNTISGQPFRFLQTYRFHGSVVENTISVYISPKVLALKFPTAFRLNTISDIVNTQNLLKYHYILFLFGRIWT